MFKKKYEWILTNRTHKYTGESKELTDKDVNQGIKTQKTPHISGKSLFVKFALKSYAKLNVILQEMSF